MILILCVIFRSHGGGGGGGGESDASDIGNHDTIIDSETGIHAINTLVIRGLDILLPQTTQSDLLATVSRDCPCPHTTPGMRASAATRGGLPCPNTLHRPCSGLSRWVKRLRR